MNILLLCNAYKSLTQHVYTDLGRLGDVVGIPVTATSQSISNAINQFKPDLIALPAIHPDF